MWVWVWVEAVIILLKIIGSEVRLNVLELGDHVFAGLADGAFRPSININSSSESAHTPVG